MKVTPLQELIGSSALLALELKKKKPSDIDFLSHIMGILRGISYTMSRGKSPIAATAYCMSELYEKGFGIDKRYVSTSFRSGVDLIEKIGKAGGLEDHEKQAIAMIFALGWIVYPIGILKSVERELGKGGENESDDKYMSMYR